MCAAMPKILSNLITLILKNSKLHVYLFVFVDHLCLSYVKKNFPGSTSTKQRIKTHHSLSGEAQTSAYSSST